MTLERALIFTAKAIAAVAVWFGVATLAFRYGVEGLLSSRSDLAALGGFTMIPLSVLALAYLAVWFIRLLRADLKPDNKDHHVDA